jgi:hypothetical protein
VRDNSAFLYKECVLYVSSCARARVRDRTRTRGKRLYSDREERAGEAGLPLLILLTLILLFSSKIRDGRQSSIVLCRGGICSQFLLSSRYIHRFRVRFWQQPNTFWLQACQTLRHTAYHTMPTVLHIHATQRWAPSPPPALQRESARRESFIEENAARAS